MSKTLYFEGVGWSGADISKATIGNCRIRTAFHLDDGQAVYLEIIGSSRSKYSSPKVFKWQYTGFVDSCHYITDEKDNDDENRHSIVSRNTKCFEYTEAEILRYVNGLGASFDAVKVVPDLGGYRVFRDLYSTKGTERYNYGDEFTFDPEMTARREAVHKRIYEEERAEGKEYPNFSLWVDKDDPGCLHLLRHFNGHNKHWTIRTDAGETVEDFITTATEAHLGRYGC